MFFNFKNKNDYLEYNPFKSCIIPRPIGWISSKSLNNIINLAPYSYFNAVCDVPPIVMFSSALKENGQKKDSIKNIEETKEFVVNIASESLSEQVLQTSQPLEYEESEIEKFNIEIESSKLVNVPRVKNALISLECKYIRSIDIKALEDKPTSCTMVFGEVVGIYLDDSIIKEGKIDVSKLKPIARLGYNEYAVIDNIFKMSRQ